MTEREILGRLILSIRTSKRITQEQLAERAGITRNNLSRIENGKYNTGIDIIIRIANALEMQLTLINQ